MLFLRALIAFLVLPAIVGGLLPWLVLLNDQWRTRGTPLGWFVFSFGVVVLLWCVRDFYVIGKGTLAPWDPPKKLVVIGLYQYVRNPMYIGVFASVLGWSLIAGSPLMAAYAIAIALAFHLRVVMHEEPTLEQLFGSEWTRYLQSVNRWWPRLSSTRKRQ
jgi:protein-S-isoprenylcysteine O-methyltransferase Ste14